MKKKVLITIPTYNERGNINALINDLFRLESDKKTKYSINILVIDDRSPDGTGLEVTRMQQTYPRLHMIQGKKNGLGAAYRRGFDHAIKKINFDVIVMMDADFSHDPADVVRLLEAIDQGNDIAIGSRYADGGMIPGNWPIMRIINTRVAHFVTRYIGGIDTEIAELTGGFKAMRKEALFRIPYKKARVSGFGFQIFLSNAFVQNKFITTEVPINFHDRRSGSSKMRFKDITEFVRTAAGLNDTTPFKTHIKSGMLLISGVIIGVFGLYLTSKMVEVGTNGYVATVLNAGLLMVAVFVYLRSRNNQSESMDDKETR